ncbi:MAG: hypothetical protein PHH54_01855 [Candidatus Nanoarchaeia archaeon]|nr:hypothetical protein [Candidatus Nanoarchaeia archaeon]MDD5740707.1 hypothetical protein [Candidatus Nanoarchaeia archaeon]
MEIELAYSPISPRINEQDFDAYLHQPGRADIARKIAIEPLEETMKDTDKEVFQFGDFKVSRSLQGSPKVSWERVYSSVLEFLKIRADDSRAFEMTGLKQFDGVGYCILVSDLNDFVNKQTEKNTLQSAYFQLFWPKMKKDEPFTREIVLPDRDYSKITEENARIVLAAKRFCSGLDKEVSKAFKEANQDWFSDETGYSMENLPEESTRRTRKIARGKYVFVNLVREEVPQYKEIISQLNAELSDLDAGNPLEGYKTKQTREGVYVNIKNVFDRLGMERLEKDKFITSKGRYEIFP